MCTDYRALNKNTVVDSYPLPRIDELLTQLKGARFLSRLDLRDDYHQLPIRELDVHKIAFTYRYSTFEYLVMYFGLWNAPSTFQRVMNQILFDKGMIVFQDDILIFAKSQAEHDVLVGQVFNRLKKAQLFVNEKKYALYLKAVEYLGHVISSDGVRVQKGKIQAVKEWPVPTSVNEVQQFLGLANYYHRFVFGFARVTAPLTELLHGKNQFSFREKQQQAFEQLKGALVGAPVLRLYDPDVDNRVLTDASGTAVGAVLEQLFDGVWYPIEYFSKRLSDAEEQYCATEREMLGIILSLQRQRPYLIGRTFKVLTDHAPNLYFNDQVKLSWR